MKNKPNRTTPMVGRPQQQSTYIVEEELHSTLLIWLWGQKKWKLPKPHRRCKVSFTNGTKQDAPPENVFQRVARVIQHRHTKFKMNNLDSCTASEERAASRIPRRIIWRIGAQTGAPESEIDRRCGYFFVLPVLAAAVSTWFYPKTSDRFPQNSSGVGSLWIRDSDECRRFQFINALISTFTDTFTVITASISPLRHPFGRVNLIKKDTVTRKETNPRLAGGFHLRKASLRE